MIEQVEKAGQGRVFGLLSLEQELGIVVGQRAQRAIQAEEIGLNRPLLTVWFNLFDFRSGKCQAVLAVEPDGFLRKRAHIDAGGKAQWPAVRGLLRKGWLRAVKLEQTQYLQGAEGFRFGLKLSDHRHTLPPARIGPTR